MVKARRALPAARSANFGEPPQREVPRTSNGRTSENSVQAKFAE
jgi:hypothetical protein